MVRTALTDIWIESSQNKIVTIYGLSLFLTQAWVFSQDLDKKDVHVFTLCPNQPYTASDWVILFLNGFYFCDDVADSSMIISRLLKDKIVNLLM